MSLFLWTSSFLMRLKTKLVTLLKSIYRWMSINFETSFSKDLKTKLKLLEKSQKRRSMGSHLQRKDLHLQGKDLHL